MYFVPGVPGHVLLGLLVLGIQQGDSLSNVPRFEPECYSQDGDMNIALLTTITREGQQKLCDKRRLYISAPLLMQVVEAFLYGIEEVNQNPQILPNITLGFTVLDTCNSIAAALAQALTLVPFGKGVANTGSGNVTYCAGGIEQHPVIGALDGGTDAQTPLVASFLGLLQIPVVSYWAASDDLSDKSRYRYLLRTVPPNKFQVEAILDFISFFNWTYLSVVYSEGSSGEDAAKLLDRWAKERHMCFAVSEMLYHEATDEHVEAIAGKLVSSSLGKVVVLFLSDSQARRLLKTLKSFGTNPGDFIWIGGVDLSGSYLDEIGDGLIVISVWGVGVPEIGANYLSLTPSNNAKNPWFGRLWEMLYGCSWNVSGNQSCNLVEDKPYTGQYVVRFVSLLVDGVNVFARALHELIMLDCPGAFVNKSLLPGCVNGPMLLKKLQETDFIGYNGRFKFNAQGDRLGKYSFWQYDFHDKDQYREIALWDKLTDSISMIHQDINWAIYKGSTLGNPPASVCSHPCDSRSYAVQQDVPCCWECRACRENERLNVNFTGCVVCGEFSWPSEESTTQCVQIEPTFIAWSDTSALTLLVPASLGLLLWAIMCLLYIKNRHSRLIKASNRKLSYVLLSGILLSFLTVFFLIVKPTRVSCFLASSGFHVSITLTFIPLLVKTSTVFRIFSNGKRGTKKPLWIGNRAQMTGCVILVLVQVALCIVSGVLAPSLPALRMLSQTVKYVELLCELPLNAVLPPLGYNLLIIAICAVFGFLARKLPQNFNESRYIFVSVSTTLFLWLVFIPTYFTAHYAAYKVVLLASCLLINASTTLVCLFVPKVYAIYYIDEEEMKITNGSQLQPSTSTSGTDRAVELF